MISWHSTTVRRRMLDNMANLCQPYFLVNDACNTAFPRERLQLVSGSGLVYFERLKQQKFYYVTRNNHCRRARSSTAPRQIQAHTVCTASGSFWRSVGALSLIPLSRATCERPHREFSRPLLMRPCCISRDRHKPLYVVLVQKSSEKLRTFCSFAM